MKINISRPDPMPNPKPYRYVEKGNTRHAVFHAGDAPDILAHYVPHVAMIGFDVAALLSSDSVKDTKGRMWIIERREVFDEYEALTFVRPDEDRTISDIGILEGLSKIPCVIKAWKFASALSCRYYGAPVYLVGSALRDPDPRDIDIVVPLSDDLFVHCYGDEGDDATTWKEFNEAHPPPMWRRWARDVSKTSAQMTMYCHRAVDFRTEPMNYFEEYEKEPKLRLDCEIQK
jgi:hypothetical protein